MNHTGLAAAIPVVLVSALLLAGCGGCGQTSNPWCSGCAFTFATTNNYYIATIGRTPGQGLGAATLTPGPIFSNGIALQWDLNTAFLYVSDPQANAIRVYQVNLKNGGLTPASVGPYPVPNPEQLLLSGNNLYVASASGSVTAFFVNANGSLGPVTGSPFPAGAGAAYLCSTGAYLYAAGSAYPNPGISAYAINPNGTGALTPLPGSPFATVSGDQPEGLACSRNSLYVSLYHAAAIGAYTIAADGSLTAIAGSPFAAGPGVSSLGMAGGDLYAAATGGVFEYALNSATGALVPAPGSPFTTSGASGDVFAATELSGGPSSSGFLPFPPDPTFPDGAAPIAAAMVQLPVIDPAGCAQ